MAIDSANAPDSPPWWELPPAAWGALWSSEQRQRLYLQHMGLTLDEHGRVDLQGRSVINFGGGPASLLLHAVNAGRLAVVDPLPMPEWVLLRYRDAGIALIRGDGEEEYRAQDWDEVWLSDYLTRVDDWRQALQRAAACGRSLRLVQSLDNARGRATDPTSAELTAWLGAMRPAPGDARSTRHGRLFVGIAGEAAQALRPARLANRPTVMRFHVPGIPHTVTNKSFLSCAYTQKVAKLCAMLSDLGHEVYHYGCEGSDVRCTEQVEVVSDRLRQAFYPDDPRREAQFRSNIRDEYHQVFYRNTEAAISERLGDRDFLLCAWGVGHQPLAAALGGRLLSLESGVGYCDTFAPYRVFESYAWMHWMYGRQRCDDGRFYDAVIPNYFDPDDFDFCESKADWFLYLGRIVKRKGVELAVEMTRELGARLVIAGQGAPVNEAEGLDLRADHVDFVGYADLAKRRHLLASAKALLCPTYYVEPFGGVAVEAMLSGTPVITTDFGAFAETVLHGVTGYRCRTLEQFLWAGEAVSQLSPEASRQWALENYSCSRVARMYQEYFDMVYGLWDVGWPELGTGRRQLEWLTKTYP